MTDEKYIYVNDIAEKKSINRSAYSVNKHRSGGVKMPSDFLSRKEREKMNGEVTSYNLSKPMTWKEYRNMPLDIRREYMCNIERKFHPSNQQIANMFGVSYSTLKVERACLGITDKRGQHNYGGDYWERWLKGDPVTDCVEWSKDEPEKEVEETTPDKNVIPETNSVCCCEDEAKRITKKTSMYRGEFEFHNVTPDAINDIAAILKLTIPYSCSIRIIVEGEQS